MCSKTKCVYHCNGCFSGDQPEEGCEAYTERYEIVKWDTGYNIADNDYLNVVLFSEALTLEQANLELEKLA